MARSMGHI